MDTFKNLPAQQLPFKSKGIKWRKRHLDWADDRSYHNSGRVRQSVLNKKTNYDLVNGKLHMDDLALILDPGGLNAAFMPENIQHYAVINSKLDVLRGEEINRRFEFRVVCTNPNAISEIEKNKQQELFQSLQNLIQSQVSSEEELKMKLDELQKEFKYNWQDLREIRANALLNHYVKEYNINNIFTEGFMDAMIIGEEIYRCDVISGEPVIEKVNPLKLRVYRSGYSNRIEDADMIVYEDYWSLGKIIDTFYDELKPADIKYLEELPYKGDYDDMDNRDDRKGFINTSDVFTTSSGIPVDSYLLFADNGDNPIYDSDGNIRVLQVYWKSRRKLLKVKSYDPETGEEIENFYTEDYIVDENKGEEATVYWVNEAWEGTKIGKELYVRMRPRPIQYNRLYNPSCCHFGFIGSLYNVNEDRVFSLVDTLKPFAYLYDVIHARLNEAIEANLGQIYELDLASVPKGWEIDKWFYYAKKHHLAVKDSFKEGNIGAGTGKLAGNFAANSRGVIGNNTGDYIQQHINLLEYIKSEMSDAVGITKQREGQISNRETVGGVERATLQSSYITEHLFNTHNDVKKRAMECFLETAKYALSLNKNKKFQYCLNDMSMSIMTIDGDEFSENDYGLVVDNSPYSQNLKGQLDALAQAALQNQMLSFSSLMKIYTNTSLTETIRLIEEEEQSKMQQMQMQQQQAMQAQQQQAEMQAQMEQAKMELEREKNVRDNETKLAIAQLQAQARMEELMTQNIYDGESNQSTEELAEKIRQFDEKMKLERDKFNETKLSNQKQNEVQQQQLDLKQQEVNIKRTQAHNSKTQSS